LTLSQLGGHVFARNLGNNGSYLIPVSQLCNFEVSSTSYVAIEITSEVDPSMTASLNASILPSRQPLVPSVSTKFINPQSSLVVLSWNHPCDSARNNASMMN